MSSYAHSLSTFERGQAYLIPGSTTISKSPKLYPYGAFPIYLVNGQGSRVEDIDGREYIDFQGALGANILGTAYPAVTEAIVQQARKGSLFSLAHPLAIEVAEKLCAMIPSAERVRLLKNGSDATSGAVRIARAYTGHEHIACCHFHGWHDWYYVTTGMDRGIPQGLNEWIHPFAYNSLESLEKIFAKFPGQIAAVIMEAVHLESPNEGYLEKVKELAEREGALLIFDEVVTGFRFARGGAQEYFGVTPHLSCLAKALSNGSSVSAIAGSEEIMLETSDVITSMTFAEETIPLAAASATLSILQEEPVVEHLFRMGQQIKEGINHLALDYGIPIRCEGYPPRLELIYGSYGPHTRISLKGYFMEKMAELGFLMSDKIFVTYSHTEDEIEAVLEACREVFTCMKNHREAPQLPVQGKAPVELW